MPIKCQSQVIMINIVLILTALPQGFFVELFSAFLFQLLLMIGLFAFMALLAKRWKFFSLSILACICLYMQLGFSWDKPADDIQADLKVMQVNVMKYNNNYEDIVDLCHASDADFISLQEITPAWDTIINTELSDSFPYQRLVCKEGFFGIGVLSKYPIDNIQITDWGYVPNICGQIKIKNKQVHFVAAHTVAPVKRTWFNTRNEHLDSIAKHFKCIEGPKLLVGDLNTVSWSKYLNALKTESALIDSRRQFQPSFPNGLGWLSIPIDHIFYSKHFSCLEFKTVSNQSSDHKAVVGRYLLN